MPPRDYAAGEEARSKLLGADPATLAQASAARTTVPQLPGGYRANQGVEGQYAGLPPPSGVINPRVGVDPLQAGAVIAAAKVAPNTLPGLLMGMQQSRLQQQERAIDNQRADAQFGLSQQTAQRQNEVAARQAVAQEQQMRFQAEQAQRQQQRDAAQQATTDIIPDPNNPGSVTFRPGGRHDPAVIARETEARTRAQQAAPAKTQGEMLENVASLRQVDKAIELLDRTKGAGIGARGYIPGPILNRADPEGVELRAAIADIGSLRLHDRSGAAVTASESPRLVPFIPLATDDSATARTKLKRFRDEYAATLRDQYAIFGPEAGMKPLAPVEEALRGSGERTGAPTSALPPPPSGFHIVP